VRSLFSRLVGGLSGPACLITFFGSAFLLTGGAQEAKADFIGYYNLSNLTANPCPGAPEGTNWQAACTGGVDPIDDGTLSSPNSTTLILTGPNDGNGMLGATTELTIGAAGSGMFQFDWTFATTDEPGYESAGYVVGNTLTLLSNTDPSDGGSPGGFVSVPVVSGETIGFYAASVDNTGGPAVLTITGFNAPATVVPEPGSIQFLMVAAFVAVVARNRRRLRCPIRVRGASVGVGIAVAAAICLTGTASAQQIYYTGTNVTGQMALMGVVNLSAQATSQTVSAQQLTGQEVPAGPEVLATTNSLRSPFSPAGFSGVASGAQIVRRKAEGQPNPTTNSLSIVQPSGISVGFNSLSQLDQRNADSGNQFSEEPPNPGIAVGNGFVLVGVNDAVQVYNVSGSPVLPIVLSSNQLFGLGPALIHESPNDVYGVKLTDMRVFFDPGINCWIVVQRAQDEDSYGDALNSSHLYMAVSQTADPTQNYNIYAMNTTNWPGHAGCPCFADYPQIGSDQYGFYIAWDEYNTATQDPVDASILALSKASLASGARAPNAVQFFPSNSSFAFAIQPATTPPGASDFLGNEGLEYFVSSQSSAYGSPEDTDEIAVWAMSETSSLATMSSTSPPSVALTQIAVPTLGYQPPGVAQQESGPTPLGTMVGDPLEVLDGGDTRVQSLTYAAGQLLLTLQTGVTGAGNEQYVGGAYIVLSPTYRGNALAAKVLNQGNFLVNGSHLLRPSLAVNAQGVGAIAVTLVGPTYYPSAAMIPFTSSTAPSTIQIAAAGTAPEDGFSGYAYFGPPDGPPARWGDYNTAVAASDGSIWMVVEYIGSYPRTEYANWNTYVFRYQ
jgi:hypothetical protein